LMGDDHDGREKTLKSGAARTRNGIGQALRTQINP